MNIISYVPGRVRFKDDDLYKNQELAQVIGYYVRSIRGVKESRANAITGSLLIKYEPETIDLDALQAEVTALLHRKSEVLEDLWIHLKDFFADEEKLNLAKRQMGLFGSLYILFKLKHWIFGKFPLSSNLMVLEVAALVTIFGAYPPLKRTLVETKHVEEADNMVLEQYNKVLMLAGIALTLVREGGKGMLLLFLKACTDYLQARSGLELKKTLLGMQPSALTMVRFLNDEKVQLQPLKQLRKGDHILLGSDEPILVTGIVTRGSAQVNCTYLMGHAGIRKVETGDKVLEGYVVVQGEIEVEIQLMPALNPKEALTMEQLQIWQQMRSDQERALYLAAPLALAGYLINGNLVTALAVLLVMNPSSTELALTASITQYIKKLQSKNILVKNLHTMEAMGEARWVLFDKTGTLTEVRVKQSKKGESYLCEELNPGARPTLELLYDLGIEHISIVSGDEHEKVKRIAKMLDVHDYYSRYTPEEKANLIKDHRTVRGPVIMVGDGMNDLHAMKCADVSIAYGKCGQAMLQADCILLEQRLELIPELISCTRQSYQQMWHNQIAGQIYSVGAGFLSMSGYLDLFQAESINVMNSIWSLWNGTGISLTKPDDLRGLLDLWKSENHLRFQAEWVPVNGRD